MVFCAPALAAPGDLDPSFSTDGQVLTNLGGDDGATAVAIDTEGRIIVAGYSARPAAGRTFAVARYLADSSLDSSFSGNGIATTAFRGDAAAAEGVAIEPNGGLVVAGTANRESTGWDFAIARYRPNGELDAGFGRNGRVTTDFNRGGDGAYGLLLQGSKIVLAGESDGDFALARYTGDGTLDSTLAGDGRVTTDFAGAGDLARAVTMLDDGNIVAAGYATQHNRFGDPFTSIALARYTPHGKLDPSFSDDGTVTTDVLSSAWSVLARPGGKLLVGGDSFLARYRPDGSLDATFGDAGMVLESPGVGGAVRGVAIQPNGRIVAAGFGTKGFGENFELSRWRSNGTPDPSFEPLWTNFGLDNYDRARGVAIEPDGKIVAVGRSAPEYGTSPGDFAIARYRVDSQGAPDQDADGFLDEVDQCPDRYATTSHGCPSFDASLTIRYSDDDGAFMGKISTTADRCAYREVDVYKVQRGPNLKIGTGYGEEYVVAARRRSGHYYARTIREFTENEVICRGARSRTMELRKR